jgi:hypothetical protein
VEEEREMVIVPVTESRRFIRLYLAEKRGSSILQILMMVSLIETALKLVKILMAAGILNLGLQECLLLQRVRDFPPMKLDQVFQRTIIQGYPKLGTFINPQTGRTLK